MGESWWREVDSKADASPSGPATSEGEAPRSKGGAPTAADSGDCAPETAKRKIGDSEPGECADPKDKKNNIGKEEEKGAKRSIGEWEDLPKRQISGQKKERRRVRTQGRRGHWPL